MAEETTTKTENKLSNNQREGVLKEYESLEDQVMSAARNCMFLLPLSQMLQVGIHLPVAVTTDSMLQSVLQYSPEEAAVMRLEPHRAPQIMKNCLPLWLRM